MLLCSLSHLMCHNFGFWNKQPHTQGIQLELLFTHLHSISDATWRVLYLQPIETVFNNISYHIVYRIKANDERDGTISILYAIQIAIINKQHLRVIAITSIDVKLMLNSTFHGFYAFIIIIIIVVIMRFEPQIFLCVDSTAKINECVWLHCKNGTSSFIRLRLTRYGLSIFDDNSIFS